MQMQVSSQPSPTSGSWAYPQWAQAVKADVEILGGYVENIPRLVQMVVSGKRDGNTNKATFLTGGIPEGLMATAKLIPSPATGYTTLSGGETGYTFAASSEYDASYQAWRGFDATNSAWLTTSGVTTGWLKFVMPVARVMKSYTVQAINGVNAQHGPKNWTIEGSNDGSSWTVVDTQTNQGPWTSEQARSYTCAVHTTPYLQYRINVTANYTGSTYLAIGTWLSYENSDVYLSDNVTLDATALDPLIVNFGSGMNQYGPISYTYSITAGGLGPWGALPNDANVYLGFKRNRSTGVVSYFQGKIRPRYTIAPPTPVTSTSFTDDCNTFTGWLANSAIGDGGTGQGTYTSSGSQLQVSAFGTIGSGVFTGPRIGKSLGGNFGDFRAVFSLTTTGGSTLVQTVNLCLCTENWDVITRLAISDTVYGNTNLSGYLFCGDSVKHLGDAMPPGTNDYTIERVGGLARVLCNGIEIAIMECPAVPISKIKVETITTESYYSTTFGAIGNISVTSTGPTLVNSDNLWYDRKIHRWKEWNGSTWALSDYDYCFVGECETNATGKVEYVYPYTPMAEYKSDSFSISNASSLTYYNRNHNLGFDTESIDAWPEISLSGDLETWIDRVPTMDGDSVGIAANMAKTHKSYGFRLGNTGIGYLRWVNFSGLPVINVNPTVKTTAYARICAKRNW